MEYNETGQQGMMCSNSCPQCPVNVRTATEHEQMAHQVTWLESCAEQNNISCGRRLHR